MSAGELIISIVPDNGPPTSAPAGGFSLGTQSSNVGPPSFTQAFRSPIDRVKAQIQERVKLKGGRPSDEVERHRFNVQWKPKEGSLGVMLSPLDVNSDGLQIVSTSILSL